MAEISIQAKETFSTGLISMYEGEIREISEEMPEEYIEEYTALLQGGNIEIYTAPIVPTGTKDITANADAIDVAEYANVNVNVPNPSIFTQ